MSGEGVAERSEDWSSRVKEIKRSVWIGYPSMLPFSLDSTSPKSPRGRLCLRTDIGRLYR